METQSQLDRYVHWARSSRLLPWPAGIRVQRIEAEEYLDSDEQLGVKFWILLEEEVPAAVVGFVETLAVSTSIARQAEGFGFDGFVQVSFAMPDEADLMPSARAGAAA